MKKRRGFIKSAILHLLKEESMHGYQIMKELESRSDGLYSASAGTIYPALQELLEKEWINLESGLEKKTYFITEEGKERLKELRKREEGDFWVSWKERMIWRNSKEFVQLKTAVDQWEEEMHKAMKRVRSNPDIAAEMSAFLIEMTERLKIANR